MAFPETSISHSPVACAENGCERLAVRSSAVCRVHLAGILRDEGEEIPFEDPELAGVAASAIWFVRSAMDGVPTDVSTSDGPRWAIDMYAMIHPNDEWPLAQLGLDMLGTHLADTPPFSGMRLEAPMNYEGEILLRLQVGVPGIGIQELRPRLESAMKGHLRELLGVGVDLRVAAEPVEAGAERPEEPE